MANSYYNMNKILLLLFVSFAVFGCSKIEEQEPEEVLNKSFKLNIKVADNAENFTAIQSAFNKNTLSTNNALNSYVNNVYYRIYKANGELLTSIKQTSMSSEFGTISQELPVGEYKVFIAASKAELLLINNNSLAKDRFGFPGAWADTFTSLTSVSVTNKDVSQTIKLERALGMLSLTITDAIPANTAKIAIETQPESSYRYINGDPESTYIGMIMNTFISNYEVGVRNKNFSKFIGNTGVPITIKVKAYNANDVTIAEKTIPNITFVKNKTTQVNVQLFTP